MEYFQFNEIDIMSTNSKSNLVVVWDCISFIGISWHDSHLEVGFYDVEACIVDSR